MYGTVEKFTLEIATEKFVEVSSDFHKAESKSENQS